MSANFAGIIVLHRYISELEHTEAQAVLFYTARVITAMVVAVAVAVGSGCLTVDGTSVVDFDTERSKHAQWFPCYL